MSVLTPNSTGRHFLAAATCAATSIQIMGFQTLKKASDLATSTIASTKDVPASDMIGIANADIATTALADTGTAIGMGVIMAALALTGFRGRASAAILAAIAIASVGFGGWITQVLTRAVPALANGLGMGDLAAGAMAGQAILPGIAGPALWAASLMLTTAVASVTIRDAARPQPLAP